MSIGSWMKAEDRCDALNKELLQSRSQLLENEEEIRRLEAESQQVIWTKVCFPLKKVYE